LRGGQEILVETPDGWLVARVTATDDEAVVAESQATTFVVAKDGRYGWHVTQRIASSAIVKAKAAA